MPIKNERVRLQVVWPHEQTLFPRLKRRLGLTFCYTRPCHLAATAQPAIAWLSLSSDATNKDAPAAASNRVASAQPGAGQEHAEESEGADMQNDADSRCQLVPLQLRPPLQSTMEPRVAPDGKRLCFLSHEQVRRRHALLQDV